MHVNSNPILESAGSMDLWSLYDFIHGYSRFDFLFTSCELFPFVEYDMPFKQGNGKETGTRVA